MAITVSNLVVYPVKSMAGIELSEAELVDTGFRFDRSWMVVDDNDRFLTQRRHPEMALVRAEPITGSGGQPGIILTFPDATSVSVPLVRADDRDRVVRVDIWGETVEAVDQGADVAGALTRYLGRPARLVFLSEKAPRQLGSSYPSPPGIHVGFADSSPLHLLSEASFHDLKGRLERPVRIDRFRANIIVSGTEAFAEDSWSRVRIGGVELLIVKDCIRCQVINVDQQTGEKEIDPLETLGSYRSGPIGPRFGRKVVHKGTGMIRVGDAVEICTVVS
ncbi:MAG: MOSC domain-containing protein [Alkalispirochaeta sp.]